MNAVIEDYDGHHDLAFYHDGQQAAIMTLTGHELDDLLAILEQRKAGGRYCDTADGEHRCTLPPGHWVLPHTCRACDHTWAVTLETRP